MASSTFDKFFDLPLEIRDQIISYLCLVPNPIQIWPTVDSEIPFPHDLLLSHPLLYAAGSAIFYEQNHFILNLRNRPRAALERAVCNENPWLLGNSRARRRIRHLELSPGRLGNAFQNHISPAVADMILNGALRHLKIVLYPTSADKVVFGHNAFQNHISPAVADMILNGALRHLKIVLYPTSADKVVFSHDAVDPQLKRAALTRRDDAFAQSKPFKALLRLLTDPDLETAELYVDPIHREFWCEFHEGKACWTSRPKGPWQLITIDWRKLAASYSQDHELSIVRVGS